MSAHRGQYLLSVVFICFATVALAAPSAKDCAVVERYVTAAADGFKAIRGKQTEHGDWIPTVFLPNANKCQLDDEGEGHVRAVCTYMFFDTQDRASGMHDIQQAVEQCLGWSSGDMRRSRQKSYKGVSGYDITVIPFGRFDARVEIIHMRH